MKAFKLSMVLAGLLLVLGISSASVLDSFGVISGESDVEGPTFYVANGDRLVAGQNFDSGDHFTNGVLSDRETVYFDSSDLPESDWYPVELNYSIQAEIDASESDVEFADIDATLRGKKNKESYKICTGEFRVNVTEDKKVFSDTCKGQLSTEVDQLELEYNLITENTRVQYAATGDTKVEVNAQ